MFVMVDCNDNYRTARLPARTLADAGHDVRIIALLSPDTTAYEESDGARIFRVKLLPHILKQLLTPQTQKSDSSVAEGAVEAQNKKSSCNPLSGVYRILGMLQLKLLRVLYRMVLFPLVQRVSLAYAAYTYSVYVDYYMRSFWVARKEKADVYHAHDLVTLPVAWLCSRITGGKLVYDAHELWLDRGRVPKRSRLNRFLVHRLESFLIRRADVNIIPGKSISKELSKRYHIPQPTVILNVPFYHPYERSTLLRDKLGIPGKEKIVLFMGRIDEHRGIEEAIRSLKYLSGCSLVIFGFGPDFYVAELKKIINDEGVLNRVYFFAAVPFNEVTRTAMSADVGLVLHQNIGLNFYYVTPCKLFDCMAAGLPVVGSNFPDLKTYVEGYKVGVTCDPTNPREIADSINYIISDENRYNEMKKNALEAAKIFNWENEGKKLVALYKELSTRR
jgi:glycosyltransferase involved in cell wall biosynthesis